MNAVFMMHQTSGGYLDLQHLVTKHFHLLIGPLPALFVCCVYKLE